MTPASFPQAMESLQIMAAANEISVDAALAALKVFEVEKMFSLKSRPALVRDEIDAVAARLVKLA